MTQPLVESPARILVTGSTTWSDRDAIERVLDLFADLRSPSGGSLRLITGMADGADEIARTWAEANDIALTADPLDEGTYPGPMHRYNEQMLTWAPDVVVAFKEHFDFEWSSSLCVAGTEHMCRIAVSAEIPVLLNGTTWLGQAPNNTQSICFSGDSPHKNR